MNAYQLMKLELLSKTTFDSEDIFEYGDSPFSEEFEKIFDFYSETLARNKKYGISPYLFFFRTHLSNNAAALTQNGHYIVFINMGLIVDLIKRFRDNHDLLIDTNNEDFIEFENLLDSRINTLMYQHAVHFTFYHEMAHLIQKSEYLEQSLTECGSDSGKFSERRHLLEFDADLFSSLCVGTHIVQYATDMFKSNIEAHSIKKLLVVFCSSYLFYFLSFRSNRLELYFFERSHPHPLIRMILVVMHTTRYCLNWFKNSGHIIEITDKEVIIETLEYSEGIAKTKFKDNSLESYRELWHNNAKEIAAYLKQIGALDLDDPSLAACKWNLNAEGL